MFPCWNNLLIIQVLPGQPIHGRVVKGLRSVCQLKIVSRGLNSAEAVIMINRTCNAITWRSLDDLNHLHNNVMDLPQGVRIPVTGH